MGACIAWEELEEGHLGIWREHAKEVLGEVCTTFHGQLYLCKELRCSPRVLPNSHYWKDSATCLGCMGTYHSIAKYAVVLVAKCRRDERVLWDNARPTGEAPKSRMWSRECGSGATRTEMLCTSSCTTLYHFVLPSDEGNQHRANIFVLGLSILILPPKIV